MFHIVFCADDNYVKYTAVLITSIIKNTDLTKSFKDFCEKKVDFVKNSSFDTYQNIAFDLLSRDEKQEGYVFHILSNGVKKETQEKLESLQKELNVIYPCEILTHILDDNEFLNFPISGAAHSNHLPYYRLKLDLFLEDNVQKCLYLDSDMLCFCDLRELFAIDLGDKIIGAVNDPGSKKRKIKYLDNGKKKTYFFDKNYFNSGFLFINAKKYKERNIQKTCEDIAKQCFYIKAADQDLLNFAIKEESLLKLNLSYNFSSISFCYAICKDENPNRLNCTRAEFLESYKQPKIIHYGEKPWKFLKSYVDSKGKNINDYWWDVAKITPAFSQELLDSKKDIKEYLVFASLGYEILGLLSNPINYFQINKILKRKTESSISQTDSIPDNLFGLCCILGEMIFFARKHKKGALSVMLKAYKVKRNFEKYSIAI